MGTFGAKNDQLFTPQSVFRNRFLGHLAPKLIEIAILKKVQAIIMERLMDRFLLARCQKKLYEQGYDILKEFIAK